MDWAQFSSGPAVTVVKTTTVIAMVMQLLCGPYPLIRQSIVEKMRIMTSELNH